MASNDDWSCGCGAWNHPGNDTCYLCRAHNPAKVWEPQGDNIAHPTHYSRWAMEPIEFIAINDLPWWLANIVKYTMRYDAKNGLEDLYKARSYLEMKIRQLEGIKRFWDKPVSEERKLNAK